MSDKVKLPKEVADVIEQLRSEGLENSVIVYSFASGDNCTIDKTLADFASDNFDKFLYALVNGYEVDDSPEDKVREYWHKVADYDPPRTAIKRVLNLLNIKIQGVNAE